MAAGESSKTTTTTDTKTLIVEQFGRAGPWALLAVLVLSCVGYELDYFLKRYVQQSDATMQHLTTNTDKLTEAVELNLKSSTEIQHAVLSAHKTVQENREMLDVANKQHAALIQLMEDAGAAMSPVAAERKVQTELLRAVKDAVEKERSP